MAVISVNVENDDKNSFGTICSDLGMNISTAINIFIKAVNRTHSIPFTLSTGKKSSKKDLTQNNIAEMLSFARSEDLSENTAAIENLRELTKNDVW